VSDSTSNLVEDEGNTPGGKNAHADSHFFPELSNQR
jgi:hypothetical protein